MLDKAVERAQKLAMPNLVLKVMDATSLDFSDSEFDKAVATYTISAVPDPVAVLREMKRVVKPGGVLVILNHFRSERRVSGWLEDMLAPVCTRLGWKSNLQMGPLLREVGLTPELVTQVNLFNGWRLAKCVNRKLSASSSSSSPSSWFSRLPAPRASSCSAPRSSSSSCPAGPGVHSRP